MATEPSFYAGFTQPESAANTSYQPQYPYNNVKQTRSGHMFEMDDTKGRERVRLHHRTGTFIEMQPNGDEVHKVYGNGFEITVKDKKIQIGGKCVVEILGDAFIHIAGDKTETVDGSVVQTIKGNYTQVVQGISSVTSQGNMSLFGGSAVNGSLKLGSAGMVSTDSPVRIRNQLGADNIYSFGRIDTGPTGGISAGAKGFVSLLGGLAIGSPVAPTGNILCVGSIFAGASVNAVGSVNGLTGNFGTMTAGLMTDTMNTSIYDFHFHFTPLGPTGFAFPGMV